MDDDKTLYTAESGLLTPSVSDLSDDEGPTDSIAQTSSTTTTTVKTSHTDPSTHSAVSSTTTQKKASHNLQRYQRHVLRLTNALRHNMGAPPVMLNAQLNETARLHNADIALVMNDLSHVSSDGRTLTERLLEQGYDFRYASENLARGQRHCQWVVNSWMKSAGHRRNLLNPRVREMGLHVGVGHGRMYWCQVFGVRRE